MSERVTKTSKAPRLWRMWYKVPDMLRTICSGNWRGLVRDFQMRYRGVDLRGASVAELGLDPARSKPYSDSGGPELARVLQSLHLRSTDVALDVGCGKGGAMITLARHGFARVDGVDLCPGLLKVARANLERLRLPYGRFICADASQVNNLDDYSFVYMYNPFPEEVMRGLMQNLGASLKRHPRPLLLLYRTPVCHQTIIESGFFVKVGERLAGTPKPFFIYTNERTDSNLTGGDDASTGAQKLGHFVLSNGEALSAKHNLAYFVSWGGEAANSLLETAFDGFVGRDLRGQRVLEIGAGGGKMSAYFALLGAEVTGVDVQSGFAKRASAEARKWGVEDRVRFLEYDGHPASLCGEPFDLIFTKSVLLYVRDIEPFMSELRVLLRQEGRVCFLENMCRGPIDVLLRNLVHWRRGCRNYHYMNRQRIAAIGRVFQLVVTQLRMNRLLGSRTSGWYLLCGRRA